MLSPPLDELKTLSLHSFWARLLSSLGATVRRRKEAFGRSLILMASSPLPVGVEPVKLVEIRSQMAESEQEKEVKCRTACQDDGV